MINHSSIFSQLLKLFPRYEFSRLVREHKTDFHSKGFSSVVWDSENEREIVLLTNHMKFGATTIAAIYKDRWQIELFFKALKQNLKIKTFIGTGKNAIKIQIWTAVILYINVPADTTHSRVTPAA